MSGKPGRNGWLIGFFCLGSLLAIPAFVISIVVLTRETNTETTIGSIRSSLHGLLSRNKATHAPSSPSGSANPAGIELGPNGEVTILGGHIASSLTRRLAGQTGVVAQEGVDGAESVPDNYASTILMKSGNSLSDPMASLVYTKDAITGETTLEIRQIDPSSPLDGGDVNGNGDGVVSKRSVASGSPKGCVTPTPSSSKTNIAFTPSGAGIFTSLPKATLDVNGDIRARGDLSTCASATVAGDLTVKGELKLSKPLPPGPPGPQGKRGPRGYHQCRKYPGDRTDDDDDDDDDDDEHSGTGHGSGSGHHRKRTGGGGSGSGSNGSSDNENSGSHGSEDSGSGSESSFDFGRENRTTCCCPTSCAGNRGCTASLCRVDYPSRCNSTGPCSTCGSSTERGVPGFATVCSASGNDCPRSCCCDNGECHVGFAGACRNGTLCSGGAAGQVGAVVGTINGTISSTCTLELATSVCSKPCCCEDGTCLGPLDLATCTGKKVCPGGRSGVVFPGALFGDTCGTVAGHCATLAPTATPTLSPTVAPTPEPTRIQEQFECDNWNCLTAKTGETVVEECQHPLCLADPHGSSTEYHCYYQDEITSCELDAECGALFGVPGNAGVCIGGRCHAQLASPTTCNPVIPRSCFCSCAVRIDVNDNVDYRACAAPTDHPTASPSVAPSFAPSAQPTAQPTSAPSFAPSFAPSSAPTSIPSFAPSVAPTPQPTVFTVPCCCEDGTCVGPYTPAVCGTKKVCSGGRTGIPHTNAVPGAGCGDVDDCPTRAPTAIPTREPTIAPSRAPTTAPTSACGICPLPDPPSLSFNRKYGCQESQCITERGMCGLLTAIPTFATNCIGLAPGSQLLDGKCFIVLPSTSCTTNADCRFCGCATYDILSNPQLKVETCVGGSITPFPTQIQPTPAPIQQACPAKTCPFEGDVNVEVKQPCTQSICVIPVGSTVGECGIQDATSTCTVDADCTDAFGIIGSLGSCYQGRCIADDATDRFCSGPEQCPCTCVGRDDRIVDEYGGLVVASCDPTKPPTMHPTSAPTSIVPTNAPTPPPPNVCCCTSQCLTLFPGDENCIAACGPGGGVPLYSPTGSCTGFTGCLGACCCEDGQCLAGATQAQCVRGFCNIQSSAVVYQGVGTNCSAPFQCPGAATYACCCPEGCLVGTAYQCRAGIVCSNGVVGVPQLSSTTCTGYTGCSVACCCSSGNCFTSPTLNGCTSQICNQVPGGQVVFAQPYGSTCAQVSPCVPTGAFPCPTASCAHDQSQRCARTVCETVPEPFGGQSMKRCVHQDLQFPCSTDFDCALSFGGRLPGALCRSGVCVEPTGVTSCFSNADCTEPCYCVERRAGVFPVFPACISNTLAPTAGPPTATPNVCCCSSGSQGCLPLFTGDESCTAACGVGNGVAVYSPTGSCSGFTGCPTPSPAPNVCCCPNGVCQPNIGNDCLTGVACSGFQGTPLISPTGSCTGFSGCVTLPTPAPTRAPTLAPIAPTRAPTTAPTPLPPGFGACCTNTVSSGCLETQEFMCQGMAGVGGASYEFIWNGPGTTCATVGCKRCCCSGANGAANCYSVLTSADCTAACGPGANPQILGNSRDFSCGACSGACCCLNKPCATLTQYACTSGTSCSAALFGGYGSSCATTTCLTNAPTSPPPTLAPTRTPTSAPSVAPTPAPTLSCAVQGCSSFPDSPLIRGCEQSICHETFKRCVFKTNVPCAGDLNCGGSSFCETGFCTVNWQPFNCALDSDCQCGCVRRVPFNQALTGFTCDPAGETLTPTFTPTTATPTTSPTAVPTGACVCYEIIGGPNPSPCRCINGLTSSACSAACNTVLSFTPSDTCSTTSGNPFSCVLSSN